MNAVFDALVGDERTRVAATRLETMDERDRQQALRRVVRRVEVSESRISVTSDPAALGEPSHAARWDGDGEGLTTIELPFDIVRRDNGARILVSGGSMPAADSSTSALVKAVTRGYAWRQRLLNGCTQSIAEIAHEEGLTRRYVARILQLGFLAPDIIAAILANRLPARITVDRLRGPIPLDWNEQRQLFGFEATERVH
jgi:hypothetical protein